MNKGAVAITLWAWSTSIIFINAHFAAHQNQYLRRNRDYSTVVSNLSTGCLQACDVLQVFEHVVWVGDLNYRIDYPVVVGTAGKEPHKDAFKRIQAAAQARRWEELLEHDQLVRAQGAKEAFVGFSEGECVACLLTHTEDAPSACRHW